MKPRLLRASLVLAGILVVLSGLAWAGIGTTAGARQVLPRLLPEGVTVDRIEGRLWGDLILFGVRVEAPSASVRVGRIALEWRPRRLLGRTFDVRRLALDSVEVEMRSAPADTLDDGAVRPRPRVPLAVRVHDLEVRHVRVRTAAGDTLALDSALAVLGARGDTFTVDSVRVHEARFRGGRGSLQASGRVVTGAESSVDTAAVRVVWQGETTDGRGVAGSGSLTGSRGVYRIDQEVLAPVPATLTGMVWRPWVRDSLRWEATFNMPRAVLSAVRPDLAGELEARGRASGGASSFQAEVEGAGTYPGVGAAEVTVRMRFGDRVVTLDTVQLRRVGSAGPATLHGAGRVELTDSVPVADVRFAWRELPLGWPLDSATTTSPRGTLRFTGALSAFDARTTLTLEGPDRSFGEWSIQASGSYVDSLVARVAYQGVVPELPPIAGAGGLRFAADRLVIQGLDIGVRGRGRAAVTGAVALSDVPRGQVEVRWTDVVWPQAGHPEGFRSPGGRVALRGTLSDFSISGQADFTGWSAPPSHLDLSLVGSADSTRVTAEVDGSGVAGGAPAVEFSGRVAYRLADRFLIADTVDVRLPETGGWLAGAFQLDMADPGRRARGRIRWADIGWPVPDPSYWSDDGVATLDGDAGEIQLGVQAHLAGTGLPDTRWRLVGHGDPLGRFVVDSVRGELLGGEVEGGGVVWNDSIRRWDLQLRGRGLNPGDWRSEWPGSVAFGLRTHGALEEQPRFTVRLDSLSGTLRSRALSGSALVEGREGRFTVDTLWLESAGSSVAAAGTIGDSIDLTWQIDAVSLADLTPDAQGRLRAEGRANGPLPRPAVWFSARGDSVSTRGWSAASLWAEGVVDLTDSSTVAAVVRGLAGPSLALDSLRIDGQGTPEDHRVTLAAHAPADRLEARLAGGVADSVWNGTLNELFLQSGQAGDWRLRAPAPLTVGRDTARVGELCWEGPGQLCAAGSWSPEGLVWTSSGRALPLAFFRPILPRALTLRGEFDLQSEGSLAPGRAPVGTFRLSGGAGAVEYERDIDGVVTQPFEGFAVNAESDTVGIRTDIELRMGALGSIRADARLPGAAPIMDRPLDGSLTARINDDGTVSRFVESLTRTQGHALVEVDISGMARSPRFDGRVAIDSVAATVVPAGIRLRDGTLSARSTESGRWAFEGGVHSDTGAIDLAGVIQPPTADSAWWIEGRITGQRFRAFQTPEILISASPDMTFFARPDSIHIGGQLRIPKARVAIRQREGTVAASPDVVILGAAIADQAPTDGATRPAQFWADVRLVLGDSVTIDALGLSGRLDGQLTIAAQPTRPPVGSGELRILDGRYRIYRQTFRIDRGRLLYASTPLTDPALDLRVTRSRSGVTAGMEITGRATDPRVALFSDPTLSDEEILAYLLVGRPLRSLSQSEGGQVRNAAQAVGVAGGNLVLARLSSVFGLETARIERRTEQTGEGGTRRETNLILGRQILPRVHLDYVIGLTGPANVLRLRYLITDHWILQTETGEERGVDLLYSIER